MTYTGTTALPYPHRERATAGLRAQLRHQLLDAGVAAVPGWAAMTVEGPEEVTDGLGRVWFQYRATLDAPVSDDGGTWSTGRRAGVFPAGNAW